MSDRDTFLDIVRDVFKMSADDVNRSMHDINNLFTRIMESDDHKIINATATFLHRAFYKIERLLLQS